MIVVHVDQAPGMRIDYADTGFSGPGVPIGHVGECSCRRAAARSGPLARTASLARKSSAPIYSIASAFFARCSKPIRATSSRSISAASHCGNMLCSSPE